MFVRSRLLRQMERTTGLAVFRTFKFRHVVKFAILSAVIGRQDGYAVCDWLKAQTWRNLTLSGCGVSHVTVNVIDVNKMA